MKPMVLRAKRYTPEAYTKSNIEAASIVLADRQRHACLVEWAEMVLVRVAEERKQKKTTHVSQLPERGAA